MKKSMKLLSLLVIFAICCCLSGCGALDELRQTRAIMNTDGTIKFYDGTTYLPLPECEGLIPIFNEFELIYLVEEEVPLLLTVFSDDVYRRSDNGAFLEYYSEEDSSLYCRSDVYDAVVEGMEQGFTGDIYLYWYYAYKEDVYTSYTLTKSQVDAINTILSTQTPEALPEAAVLDYDYWVDLMLSSEEQLFMTDTVDLCLVNDKYYVVDYSSDATILYSVPQSLSHTFEDIFQAHIENESYWEDMW